jgi:mRNA interferase MazF
VTFEQGHEQKPAAKARAGVAAAATNPQVAPGQIWWADVGVGEGAVGKCKGEGAGREQEGRRPVVVVADHDYLVPVDALAIVMPLTKVDRGWPNHVHALGDTGIDGASWIMTEQIRTISRKRLRTHAGSLSPESLNRVKWWASVFLGLPAPQ